MRTARFFALLLVLLGSLSLSAQDVLIGNEIDGTPDSGDGDIGVTRTDIDLGHPAMCAGSISSAQVYWSAEPMPGCTMAFKIKFFRRVGDSLTMTAERGPFHPDAKLYRATLTPSVPVQQGDLIGIARVSNCGSPTAFSTPSGEGYLQYARDVTGTVEMSAAAAHRTGVLAIGGSGTITEALALVVPVVGSTPGAFGSYFKTELQIFRPDLSFSGQNPAVKLVLHRAGVAGSFDDATHPITLRPGEMFSTADIVALMGQTGTGSLDIILPPGPGFVTVLARVYDDAGTAGTSGLTEEGMWAFEYASSLPQAALLGRGTVGYLITPRDPLRTRFNVGVRTLHSGATIEATLRDSSGVVVRRKTHTYTATWFVQTPVEDFVGGPIAGDESIRVVVLSGSAFVYGSTTDNITNDPSIQFVRRIGEMP